MSDIPKSKRKKSKLQASVDALNIRTELGNEFLMSFALSPKRMTSAVEKATRGIKSPEEKAARAEIVRKAYDGFAPWFIERHRSELTAVAAELGLVVHPRKTRIVKLSSTFKHLQVKYSCAETGRVHRRISSKNITRERRKIKAYKHLVDEGRMTYDEVKNAFKSWLGTHWRYMSHTQIYNLSSLYLELFGRRPKWKKGHSKLHWLMAHPSTISSRTGTTSSPGRRSARRPSTAGSIMS